MRTDTQPGGCVVFRDDFGNGEISVGRPNTNAGGRVWSSMLLDSPGQSSVALVADPAGAEQFVARFVVPDDGRSFGTEIQHKLFQWGRYRYAVSHYIPSTWPRFRQDAIITRWLGHALVGSDGKPRNLHPPIALAVHGLQPHWQLHLYKMLDKDPRRNPLEIHPIRVPLIYDRWNDWVFDITWSRRDEQGETITPGLIVLTLNGERVLRIEGDNNYHQEWPPCFQMGIYKPSWREAERISPARGNPLVVFQKNLVVTRLNVPPHWVAALLLG